MILITGLPRTASSFLCEWFSKEGNSMHPACYSDNLPTTEAKQHNLYRQLCEPITLTHEITFNRHFVLESILEEISKIEKENSEMAKRKQQVLKCSQMVFYRYCLHRFTGVIICLREKESWIKSAKEHGTFSWIYKVRPYWIPSEKYFEIINSINPEELFYEFWHDHCHRAYLYCKEKSIPVIVYKYGDDESFACLHEYFCLQAKGHGNYDYWIERRF